jgi:hypothetical protein
MVLVLEPVTPVRESEVVALRQRVPTLTFPVDLPILPGRATPYRMPLDIVAAQEVLALAYAVSGREGVDVVMRSVDPVRQRAIFLGSRPLLEGQARYLLEAVEAEQLWLASEALNEIEMEARDVFLELLEAARGVTQLDLYGMLEASRGMAGPPVVDLNPLRDGGATYRALRTAVLDLDAAARVIRSAEQQVRQAQLRGMFVSIAYVITLVNGSIPGPDPLAGLQSLTEESLRLAGESYAKVLQRHAERFPALSMVAGAIVAATGEWPRPDVESLAADTQRYDNRLDMVIRTEIGTVCRNTWRDGVALARRTLEAADGLVAYIRSAGRAASPPERVYANHPLWRYPLIIHAALERLGYAAGSLPHTAAVDALRVSAEEAARRSREEQESARALDWANFGFGVLAFVPVVGQLALAGAFAVSLTQAVAAASSYFEQREQARAFGPYAADLGLTDPEGAGWIALSFVGLVFDVVPVFRACGELGGRLVRLTALPRPVSPGLLDVIGLGTNLLSLTIAQRAADLGVQDPRG